MKHPRFKSLSLSLPWLFWAGALVLPSKKRHLRLVFVLCQDFAHAHLLHVLKDGRRSHSGRGFLDDLLVPPLDGAVPAEQGNGVAILVSQDLDFQMAGVLQEPHHEDGGPRDLALHLLDEGQENQRTRQGA